MGCKTLTYTRHSWPLSNEGSLPCHTYCDKGYSLIIAISEASDTNIYCHEFSSTGAVTTCVYDLGLYSNTQPSACETSALTHCATGFNNKIGWAVQTDPSFTLKLSGIDLFIDSDLCAITYASLDGVIDMIVKLGPGAFRAILNMNKFFFITNGLLK